MIFFFDISTLLFFFSRHVITLLDINLEGSCFDLFDICKQKLKASRVKLSYPDNYLVSNLDK